ncbi:MAG: sugar phosphate isomerase/epimerase family protein [Acidimicrobiales bacterium]
MTEVLLGTVAIEPNRWGLVDPARLPTVRLSEHLDQIADAGFDGLEVWEGHLSAVDPAEVQAVIDHQLGVSVFNSYVGFDDPNPDARAETAAWVTRCHADGVKYNVGNQPDQRDAYADRIAEWVGLMPSVRLLCECHEGISIAEDPEVAATIFAAAGPPDQVQAIIHLGEDEDLTRRRFDAYGDRITHVHVNYLSRQAPLLRSIANDVEERVELVRSLGFAGSWTIEFTNGVLTDNQDEPEHLLSSAIADLEFLRKLLP